MSINDLMFKNKYLKYKAKYLELKEQEAGSKGYTIGTTPTGRDPTGKESNKSATKFVLTDLSGVKLFFMHKEDYQDQILALNAKFNQSQQVITSNSTNIIVLPINDIKLSDLIIMDVINSNSYYLNKKGQKIKINPVATPIVSGFQEYNSMLKIIFERVKITPKWSFPLELYNMLNTLKLPKEENTTILTLILKNIFDQYFNEMNNKRKNYDIFIQGAENMAENSNTNIEIERYNDFLSRIKNINDYVVIIGEIVRNNLPNNRLPNELKINVKYYISTLTPINPIKTLQ